MVKCIYIFFISLGDRKQSKPNKLNIMNDALRLESRGTMQYCDGYKIKTVLVAGRLSHQEPIQGSVPHIAGIVMEKIRDNQLL